MKAMMQDRYGSAEVLELRDVEDPAVGDDDVLVRVHAAGCGPDVWHLMTGLPYLVRLMFGFRRLKVPVRGRDVAGRVEAVGANVTGFRPGDEVMGVVEGSFAELAIARPDKLVRKPAGLSFEQAAALPISGLTALQAIRDQARSSRGSGCWSSARPEASARSPSRSPRRSGPRSPACAAPPSWTSSARSARTR